MAPPAHGSIPGSGQDLIDQLEQMLFESQAEANNLRRHLAWSVISTGGRVAIPASLVIADPPFTLSYAQDSRGDVLFIQAELAD